MDIHKRRESVGFNEEVINIRYGIYVIIIGRL